MSKEAIEFAINAKDKASSVFGGVGKALGGLLGAFSAYKVAAFVKETINLQDAMLKLSQRANLSVTAFSELAHAGDLANISGERIVTTLAFISRATTDAAYGAKQQADSFNRLGISTTDMNGQIRTSQAILEDLADVIKENGASAQVMEAGMSIAGRGFNEMIPLLRQGREGLRAAAEDARFLGISLGAQATANAEKFNDELTRLGGAAQGVSHAFSNELIPVLSGIIQVTTRALAGQRDFFRALGEGAATAVVFAIAAFELLGKKIISLFNNFKQAGVDFIHALGLDPEGVFAALDATLKFIVGFARTVAVAFIESFKFLWGSFYELGRSAFVNIKSLFTGGDVVPIEELLGNIAARAAEGISKIDVSMRKMWDDYEDSAKDSADVIGETFSGALGGDVIAEIAARAEELKKIFTDLGTAQVQKSEIAAQTSANDLVRQLEARKAYLAEKMALIDQEFLGENERQALQDELRLINLQLAGEKGFTAKQNFNMLEMAAEQQKQGFLNNLQQQAELRRLAVSKMTLNAQLAYTATALGSVTALMSSENEKQFKIGKAASIAQAVINTYTAAVNAYMSASAIPIIGWILGPIAAAAAIALGMAQVSKIRSTQFGGQAHAGMTTVPNEGSFLLNRGERVLSPEQNKDLTGFLESERGGGGGVYIDKLEFHILENATSFESLMNLNERQIQELIAGRLYPAIAVLDRRGIRPTFVERYSR